MHVIKITTVDFVWYENVLMYKKKLRNGTGSGVGLVLAGTGRNGNDDCGNGTGTDRQSIFVQNSIADPQ